MPKKADLTIAILTHNRPAGLKKCLDSIHLQSLLPQKILVIDDTPSLTTIPQKRNYALKKCHTRYLAFVDDDCTLDKDWLKNALFTIVKTKATFVIGRTLAILPLNKLSGLQFKDYQNWFEDHLRQNDIYALNEILDTKNILLDRSHLANMSFDERFNIFEDIDFGLQLKKASLWGKYCPQMIIHHHENHSPISLLKKTYRRGKFKKLLNAKWGNFDKFVPSLMTFSILRFTFSLGYYKQKTPLITIINSLDRGANGQRAQHFYQYIKSIYHDVKIYDSEVEFKKAAFNWDNLFIYGPTFFAYHFHQILKYIFHLDFPSQHFSSYLDLRGSIINHHLNQSGTTLAILQYPEDIATLQYHHNYQVLYDSPTLFADELHNDQRSSPHISTLENYVFQTADWVSFHWYTYFDLLHQKGIFPKKEVALNWGCNRSPKQAKYSTHPRIIYLGILNSDWANPKLLIQLSSQYPIDVFSYETPDPKIYPPGSINYCGYLKNITDLSLYQFGLITISTDPLRANGFSAKYLDYLNYGLPVLCPVWRQDQLLKPATIYYHEKNFGQVILLFQDKKHWLKKHLAAQELAQELTWNNNLSALTKIIDQKST